MVSSARAGQSARASAPGPRPVASTPATTPNTRPAVTCTLKEVSHQGKDLRALGSASVSTFMIIPHRAAIRRAAERAGRAKREDALVAATAAVMPRSRAYTRPDHRRSGEPGLEPRVLAAIGDAMAATPGRRRAVWSRGGGMP